MSEFCYAQSLPQVLSKQNLRDAYYRIPYRTAQKRCPTCPEPKYGYDLTTDTLISYVAQDINQYVVINKMKPVDKLPNMTFNASDSTDVGETATGYTYKGKQVYQQSIYSNFTADQVIVKSGMDKVIDVAGWVAFTHQYSDKQVNYRSSAMCRGCNYELTTTVVPGQRVLVVNKPKLDLPFQSNHRFYMKIRYTKL
jgi:hypothetical protein